MPKKVLLADDSITIQKVISLTFASEDFDLIVVGDGDSAITKARETVPDLIMADVAMPGKNGYEVCEAVKNDPALSAIPVLLLAGTFEPLEEGEATRVGADGHIVKPFESEELLAKVKDLIASGGGAPAAAAPEVATVVEPPPAVPPISVPPIPVPEAPPVAAPPTPTPPAQAQAQAQAAPPQAPGQAEDKGAEIWEATDFLGTTPEEAPAGAEPAEDVSDFFDLDMGGEAEPAQAAAPAPAPPVVAPPIAPSVAPPAAPVVAPVAPPVAAPTPPPPIPAAPEPMTGAPGIDMSTLPKDQIEEIVRKAAREIIEEVAWEVIPELAEELIREEILNKVREALKKP